MHAAHCRSCQLAVFPLQLQVLAGGGKGGDHGGKLLHHALVVVGGGGFQRLQLLVELRQVDVPGAGHKNFVVLGAAHLVLLLVHHQLFVELLAGAQAHHPDLHVHARLVAVKADELLGKEDAPCDHMYDVVGGLCENNDKFAIDRMLPKIDIGDVLYIHDTGAHGSAMGYNYNGKLRSAEVLLCEDGSHRLIRRAETPRDYFATLDFLPLMKPLFED